MQWSPFVMLAMALDTLPVIGRVLLLAVLLSCALYGFLRVLPDEPGSTLNLLYRKGALLALVLVPTLVYLLEIQVPVPVEELVTLGTPWPRYVTMGLCAVWLVGVAFHLYRVAVDLTRTVEAATRHEIAHSGILQRAGHWQQRLNLKREVTVLAGGAEQGWHVGTLLPGRHPIVVIPAAALNWPSGLVDALLLGQLAQLFQGSWRWLVVGRLIQALYWPMPWVGTLVRQLADNAEIPGQRLAAAAYRDPEGWQRDVRNLAKRASTLQAVPTPAPGTLLRLPNSGQGWIPPRPVSRAILVDGVTFEDKWEGTKRFKRGKERDPYEQAYWLIAVASIVVGVATTLTLVQAPPEFEPRYLNIKWQDQMVRRLRDDYADEMPDENPPD